MARSHCVPPSATSLCLALSDNDASQSQWARRFVSGVRKLAREGFGNPWAQPSCDDAPGNHPTARRQRLAAHLSVQPRLLLMGEAPGYAGARCTGVTFSSERLFLDGAIPRCQATTARLSTRTLPWSEPSATIVWRALYSIGVAEHTWLWNACALHPRGEHELSNATPDAAALADSRALMHLIVLRARHHGATVVAVGEVAAKSLRAGGCPPDAVVRHPARGGATLFAQGLAAVRA